MQWQVWLIPLIALFVIIVSMLAAKQPQRPAPRSRDPRDGLPQPPRRGMEEPEPIYVPKEIPPRPVQQRRPVPPKPPPRRREPVVVVQPVRAEAPPYVVTESEAPPPPPAPAAPQAVHRPEALPAKAPLTPVAKTVRTLLKNRQSMRAALLLHEILGPPLCKRRRL